MCSFAALLAGGWLWKVERAEVELKQSCERFDPHLPSESLKGKTLLFG
jgi:hypothetical protein